MKTLRAMCGWLVAAAMAAGVAQGEVLMQQAKQMGPSRPSADDVMVAVGDSITDGNTYPQLVMQALRDAGRPVPAVVCSGTVCDTAPQMLQRVESSVLRYRPTLVTFTAGSNDAMHDESPEEYEKAVRAFVDRVQAAGARVVLLTPCIINEKPQPGMPAVAHAAEKRVEEYARIIDAIAAEKNLPVARSFELQKEARAAGREVMSGDGLHPNYYGQSLIARAVLDALDCADVPLPAKFDPPLFPGVLAEWRFRLTPQVDGKPQELTAEGAATLARAADLKPYRIPDPTPVSADPGEFFEQVRRNGFGLTDAVIGKGPKQGVATLVAAQPRKVWISTSMNVGNVFLNGKLVTDNITHDDTGKRVFTSFHAGAQRFEAQLERGTNTIAIAISGNDFFLGVTDELVWETQLR